MVWYLVGFVSPAGGTVRLGRMSLNVGTQGRLYRSECPWGKKMEREGGESLLGVLRGIGWKAKYRLIIFGAEPVSSCPKELQNSGAV